MLFALRFGSLPFYKMATEDDKYYKYIATHDPMGFLMSHHSTMNDEQIATE